jgi:type IV secretion system protein VirD4
MESKQEKEAESIEAALAEIERELDDLEKSGLFAVDNSQSAG